MENKYFILTNEKNERAFEISEPAYRKLWDIMDTENNVERAFHIVKGEDTLEELFPNAKIMK